MSDSPPKPASDQTPAEAPKEPTTVANDPPEKPESSASAALADAAKGMDAVVVKSDVPAPAADAAVKDSPPANTDAPKTDLSKVDPPRAVVDLMQMSATTSGMHQQYIAPGVARQSFFSSNKYQGVALAGMVAVSLLFFLRGSGGDFGIGDNAATQGGGTISTTDDPTHDLAANNNVKPPPIPQADFTVNAATIGGDNTVPIARMHSDGGTQNKGGYEQERRDLEAADSMVDKDPVKALQMVDQHDTDYPRGMLDPEARVIRIEAYAKKGDDAKALGLGNDFLDDYPHSPRAGRVVAIVEALKNKLDSGRQP